MSVAVKVSDDLAQKAKVYGAANQRSMAKQVEYWAKLGRTAEQNPELTIGAIQELFQALAEAEAGDVTEFKFSDED